MVKEKTTLEYIKECINVIHETDEYLEELYDLNFNAFERITSMGNVIDLLEWLIFDKYSWLSWYAYEKEYGKRKEMKAFDKKNKEIPTETIEDILNIVEENIRLDIANGEKTERDPELLERVKKELEEEKEYLNALNNIGIDITKGIKTTGLIEKILSEKT